MAVICPFIFWQVLDNNGDPLNGGKVYTYEAGTTTPKDTFTDEGESATNTNPVILDSSGRAEIWLGQGEYKFVAFDRDDNLIDTRDNISGVTTGDAVAYDISATTNIAFSYNQARIFATNTIALNLLAANDAGDGFEIYVKNVGAGTITINPDGSETINGNASLEIGAGEWSIIYCDDSEWYSFNNENLLPKDNTFTGNNIFQGVVDVTNVNAESSSGGNLRTNGGTNCLSWGGGGSANLTLGGNVSAASAHKIVNLVDPTSAQDAATKAYVDGLIASGTVSASGEIELQGIGLQIKWGTYSAGVSSGTISFGTAFDNNCFGVLATPDTTNRNTVINTLTTSGFNFQSFISTTGGASATGFFWMAIGN